MRPAIGHRKQLGCKGLLTNRANVLWIDGTLRLLAVCGIEHCIIRLCSLDLLLLLLSSSTRCIE